MHLAYSHILQLLTFQAPQPTKHKQGDVTGAFPACAERFLSTSVEALSEPGGDCVQIGGVLCPDQVDAMFVTGECAIKAAGAEEGCQRERLCQAVAGRRPKARQHPRMSRSLSEAIIISTLSCTAQFLLCRASQEAHLQQGSEQ